MAKLRQFVSAFSCLLAAVTLFPTTSGADPVALVDHGIPKSLSKLLYTADATFITKTFIPTATTTTTLAYTSYPTLAPTPPYQNGTNHTASGVYQKHQHCKQCKPKKPVKVFPMEHNPFKFRSP